VSRKDSPERRSFGESAQNLIRAVGAGLLIGLPLLFTQELWANAFVLHPHKIVLLLVVAFVVVVGYNTASGFRAEGSALDTLIDSIEAMGLGILVALVVLILFGRIEADMGIREIAGKVSLEAIPIAFGASLARSQLASPEDEPEEGSRDGADEASEGRQIGPAHRLFVAAGGALLFALDVAPTDEVVVLGMMADWPLLIAVMAVSLLITLALVFYADFRGGRDPNPGDSPMDHPLGETLAAYAISLGVSLAFLWAFDRTDGVALPAILGMTVLLALLLVVEGMGPMSRVRASLRPEDGRAIALGWSVPGTLSNAGDDAAEAVVVEARATVRRAEETSEVEVMFLPGGSSVDVGFGFSAQPDGVIEARLRATACPDRSTSAHRHRLMSRGPWPALPARWPAAPRTRRWPTAAACRRPCRPTARSREASR
jgi:putative integral membrane protein (TIGR02587 family)